MSRPRKATDDEVFAAASRVLSRVGPVRLKLSDIAAEAGVTAGALVQRFGSKRGLLLGLTQRAARLTEDLFERLRAAHASPLGSLRAYADCLAGMGESPEALGHGLAALQMDLADAELRQHVVAQGNATRQALRALLEAAVAKRELRRPLDAARLARTVDAVLSGSLLAWAFYREGTASRWLREDLETVLQPHLVRGRRARRPSRPARKRRP